MSTLTPMFTHDCKRCVFLGHYHTATDRYDLYYCTEYGTPTVLARYGSGESEYTCGIFLAPLNHPIAIAREMAERRGLILGPENPNNKTPAGTLRLS